MISISTVSSSAYEGHSFNKSMDSTKSHPTFLLRDLCSTVLRFDK